jgi:hypothetical protein
MRLEQKGVICEMQKVLSEGRDGRRRIVCEFDAAHFSTALQRLEQVRWEEEFCLASGEAVRTRQTVRQTAFHVSHHFGAQHSLPPPKKGGERERDGKRAPHAFDVTGARRPLRR